ncbi:carbon starvation protein A, partial [Veillonella atypica]|nr:carbon starvation protein A [Veillonella atypica]
VFNSYVPAGKWVLVSFSAAMFLMILIVVVEAVRSWIRLSNIPQDYRTQEEIEAESLVKYGKEVKA